MICDSNDKKLSDGQIQDFCIGSGVGSAIVVRVAVRIDDCAESAFKTYTRCVDCGSVRVTIGHCYNRFCEHCLPSRFARNKDRLAEKMQEFPTIVTHLILTMPTMRYTRESKFRLSDARRKFFQILKRRGIKFAYVGVYDYGNPKGDDPLETNLHVHIALAVPYSFFLNPTVLQNDWARATGIENAVVRIKKAKRSAVVRYFARRASGDFGHASQEILFSDYMTLKTYVNVVYKSRYVVAVATALSGNVVPNRHISCELCGGNMEFMALVYNGIIKYAVQDCIISEIS